MCTCRSRDKNVITHFAPRHQDIHSFFRTNTEIITNLLLTSHFLKSTTKRKFKKYNVIHMYPLAKKNLLNKQAIKIETRNKQNNNIVKLFFYIFFKNCQLS